MKNELHSYNIDGNTDDNTKYYSGKFVKNLKFDADTDKVNYTMSDDTPGSWIIECPMIIWKNWIYLKINSSKYYFFFKYHINNNGL